MLKSYCDLHVHLGRAAGKPVKITASSELTLLRAIDYAERVKGINVLGIVDAACSGVLQELTDLICSKELSECPGGGFRTPGGLLIIPGSEWEMEINGARVHFLAFFPGLGELKTFHSFLGKRIANAGLSTQFLRDGIHKALPLVTELGGQLALAHAFTPFKGYFGQLDSLKNLEGLVDEIDFIELGLSADRKMADQISELHSFPFIVGSDAHSGKNIGREYLEIDTGVRDFEHLFRIVSSEEKSITFRGFPPSMGKYFATRCRYCGFFPGKTKKNICPRCSKNGLVPGVSNRISDLSEVNHPLPKRPEYLPHLPLHLLPGFGPGTINTLYQNLGTEMEIIHNASPQDLGGFLDRKRVEMVLNLREGDLVIEKGGGGKYGKVLWPEA